MLIGIDNNLNYNYILILTSLATKRSSSFLNYDTDACNAFITYAIHRSYADSKYMLCSYNNYMPTLTW